MVVIRVSLCRPPATKPAWCLIYFLLLLSRAPVSRSQNQTCNPGDLAALRGFLSGLPSGIRGWGLNASSSSDCCRWSGVSCEPSTGRVIGLNLANMSLKGAMTDASLSALDCLQVLNLSSNSLSGSVPPELFSLPQLKLLDLSLNQFDGHLPPDLRLRSIKHFNVSRNFFNGSLPRLAGSTSLEAFDVGSNMFAGRIDAGICHNSTRLRVLRLSMNMFSGVFPAGFGNCSSLTELALDMNMISGSLPDDLFELSSLTEMYLQGNELYGPINPRIGNLTNLVQLDVSQNGFSGAIPDVFGSLAKLKRLSAQSNILTGGLPASLSELSNLEMLNLRNNSMSGAIDLNFPMMIRLSFLDLGWNAFTGPIPYNLSSCEELMSLNLARNNLIGEIPDSFRNLTSLTYISLSNNSLSNLSSALGILQHLPNLTSFVLTMNFYGGEVMPVEGIQGFKKAEVLVIANCALSGSIPLWLSNCARLKVLDISWNYLEGAIPYWLGNLDSLFYMDLSNNSLTGEIPDSLTQMKSLIMCNSSQQGSYVQNIPFFVKRNMSARALQYNQVSSFPPSLILSYNLLVGPILRGFGDLRELLVLDLRNNNLSGMIPQELSRLTSLETLQLSHNNLTGSIPSSLANLTFLSSFDVAYNNLSGPIPTGGQFSTFSSVYFEGNPGLCGFHSSACPSETASLSGGSKRKHTGSVLGMAIGIGLGTALLITILYIVVSRTHSRRQEVAKVVADADESLEYSGPALVLLFQNKGNKEVRVDDIRRATNNFDQAYIVGCGGFGLVYKGTLPDGKIVAIKRLSGDFCQMEREFQAEVETLSRAQHRNLVLLQGYCRIGNDRLLIYSYMENGSLDYWLHEKLEERSTLNWETRLKIALGAARGLLYLHLSCQPHILHRDIKSSNILLNENFEAHLADFGLARLILPCDTHVTTDLVGTLGYIPPEYGQASIATCKGDVYSFGVVLLELLTGRRPLDMCKPKGSRDLIPWVLQMKEEKNEAEVFDPYIYDKEYANQMMQVLEVACLCVSESPKLRPLTQELVAWLENIG